MKTIRINAPLTIIREVCDTTSYSREQPGFAGVDRILVSHETIEAVADGPVNVVITGRPDMIRAMTAGTPTDPHSLIQRALSTLGYVVGDHQKDVAQFSRWVDRLTTFPQTEEAKSLWSEAMLRLFGSDSPPLVPSTIAEASGACGAFVVEQMRLFPPRISGMDIGTEAWSELQEWRTIAKEFGWDSPVGMRGVSEQVRQWQDISDKANLRCRERETVAKQRGWSTPLDLRGQVATNDAELNAWRAAGNANGIRSPSELVELAQINFGQYVDRKVNRDWQLATACESPKDAEDLRSAWHSETNCMFPREAGDKLRTLKSALKLQESRGDELVRDINAWKKATGCESPEILARSMSLWSELSGCENPHAAKTMLDQLRESIAQWQAATNRETPELAKELLLQIEGKSASVDARNDELVRDIRAWKKATGATDPANAINMLAEQRDAIRLEWQEVTGAMNPHAAMKKLHDLESKLLSYASEIDALRKVAQSTKHDPVTVELDHGTPLTANGKTIGIVINPERELAKVKAELDSKRRECATEKERADAEFRRRVDAEKYLFDIDSAQFEFTRVRPGYARLAEELTSSWKQASLRCATLSDSLTKERMRASTAEGMLKIEQQKHDDIKKELLAANQFALDHSVMWNRMSAAIGMEQTYMIDIVQWIEDVQKKLATAIIPLPKPDKVKAGQRWAFVMTATDKQEPKQSPSTVGDFKDAYGHKFTAFAEDIASAIFLGS